MTSKTSASVETQYCAPEIVVATPQPACDVIEQVIDFFVTTDSVVAVATVVTDRSSVRIEVSWGDGEADTLRLPPGLLQTAVLSVDAPLPKGTYQFTHVYQVSEDGMPFDQTVQLRVDNRDGPTDTRLDLITLTPRYKVNHYETNFYLKRPCDPFYERVNELKIVQRVDGSVKNIWKDLKVSNNFFGLSQQVRLSGSSVAREMTMEEPPISVIFDFTEDDTFFDDEVRVSTQVSPRGPNREDGLVEISRSGDGCHVAIRYYREIRLIKKRTYNGPVFSDEPGAVTNPN